MGMELTEEEQSPELGPLYEGFTKETRSGAQWSSLFELAPWDPYLRTFKSITK